jgi:hypothetical protein
VRIRRESALADLLPEAVHLRLADPPFEERARVDARRAVALDVEQVAHEVVGGRVEEVVEADVVECRRAREARDVTAELGALAVGLHDQRERVPADDRADPVLEAGLARRHLLVVDVDGVEIGGGRLVGQVRARAARLVDQPLDQVVGALRALARERGVERVEPLLGFLRVAVGRRVGHQ